MADNQIDVSSVGDSRITKYSSANINKSLSLARKISNSTAKEGIEKYELEDYRSAIDNFTQSIRLDPNYAEAYWWRAGAKYYSGNYQAAIDDYTQSIKLNPDCVDSYNLRAVTKYELEDYQGAIDDITQSIKLDPENDYSAYSFRANAKEKLGYYQAAIDDYDLAIYKCKDKGKSFQPLLHSRDRLLNKL